MHKRVQIRYEIKLLSDAIFGSGESVPGSVDLAVYKDQDGLPYFKATSMKGLLREAAELLLAWENGDQTAVAEIFGEEGWNGVAGWRRLHLTDAKLEHTDEEDYFDERAFTSLENQVAKAGTLRSVECVKRGLCFAGECECAAEDTDLLKRAFRNVKWIGSKRSRGFGQVRIRAEVKEQMQQMVCHEKAAPYLRYELETQTPVIMTDYARSGENAYETCGYITGSAMRGCIIGKIAEAEPEWFEAHKKELLEHTTFFNALPKQGNLAILPSVKGFYERKDGGDFQTVLKNGQLHGVVKRAGLGQFCSLSEGKIRYWSAKTDGRTRIRRPESRKEDTVMFQNGCLKAGQTFEGYIGFSDEEICEKVMKYLGEEIWIGADRYEGFGKCKVKEQKGVTQPDYRKTYGYTEKDKCPTTQYLLAVSPLAMQDAYGENCGLDLKELAQSLQVSSVQMVLCSTSVSEYGGYNRTWRSELPLERMYDAGSIFRLECAEAPTVKALQKIQEEGLGMRRSEGYGQVLFLREELFCSIKAKEEITTEKEDRHSSEAEVRRSRCRWLLEMLGSGWQGGLSNSQVGELQSRCEAGMRKKENWDAEVRNHLKSNLRDRGIEQKRKYEKAGAFVTEFLDTDQSAILGAAKGRDVKEKLKLLCDLMDLERKEK